MSDFIIKLYNSYLDTIYLKMRVLKKKKKKKENLFKITVSEHQLDLKENASF